MNVYDFDQTIYDGDCSVDFFLYALLKKKRILFMLPHILKLYLLYKIRKVSKRELKEGFFSFISLFDSPKAEIKIFAKRNRHKIKTWYIEQMKSDDIIITASPQILVQEFLNELLGQECIGTMIDRSGRLLGENCYGEEKVIRYREKYKNNRIYRFYTDSVSDLPMADLAEEVYLVKKDKRIKIK